MKRKFFVFLFFMGFFVMFSQEKYKPNLELKNQFISEVYGVLNTDSQLYKNLDNLLTNRIEFVKDKDVDDKYFENISDFPLFNKYNVSLKRDKKLNPENFNVLKYNLTFYSTQTQVYRFRSSDWLIIIYP